MKNGYSKKVFLEACLAGTLFPFKQKATGIKCQCCGKEDADSTVSIKLNGNGTPREVVPVHNSCIEDILAETNVHFD
jgi:hypothetical protein